MSSPSDGNGKKDDHSAYAPKWVRDSNRETSQSPSIGEDKFPQRSEQSFSETGPATDQARAHRPLDTTFTRDERLTPRAWSRRAETELPESDEEPPLRRPRSLDPQFMRDPPRAPRAIGRLAAVAGLIIAASVGAAIALFATGKLPSELNKMFGVGADKTTVASKLAADPSKTPEQASSTAAQPTIASTEPQPIGEDLARVTSARSATERTPTIRGVTDNEIRLGISAPFTGSAKEEQQSGDIIPLTETHYIAGSYPAIESYLKDTHGIETKVSYAAERGDALEGQTWTFARGEHIIIVRDIPRTIFRLSGLS